MEDKMKEIKIVKITKEEFDGLNSYQLKVLLANRFYPDANSIRKIVKVTNLSVGKVCYTIKELKEKGLWI